MKDQEQFEAEQFWQDAQLGKKVRAQLASPHASTQFILAGLNGPAQAWDWLRLELLGAEAEGSLQTGGIAAEKEGE
jgi:hypothetical protein